MDATTLNTARPDWFPGQVTVNSQTDFKLVLEGKANNGGFAVDQLVFSPGKCESEYNFCHHKLVFRMTFRLYCQSRLHLTFSQALECKMP